jgi:hypothetical protein
MDDELHQSLMAAMERTKLKDCEIAQIDALRAALASGDRQRAAGIVDRGSIYPAGRLWADDAWSATVSAQVSDHLPPGAVLAYSQLYDLVRDMRQHQEALDGPAEVLAMIGVEGAPQSPAITYGQMAAATRLRNLVALGADGAATITDCARTKLGLTATEAQFEEPGHTGVANVAKCKADAAALGTTSGR